MTLRHSLLLFLPLLIPAGTKAQSPPPSAIGLWKVCLTLEQFGLGRPNPQPQACGRIQITDSLVRLPVVPAGPQGYALTYRLELWPVLAYTPAPGRPFVGSANPAYQCTSDLVCDQPLEDSLVLHFGSGGIGGADDGSVFARVRLFGDSAMGSWEISSWVSDRRGRIRLDRLDTPGAR